MREHAEGPRKTTGWTGRVRKAREGLSRPVLIGRAACPLRPPPIRDSGRAGGEDMDIYTRDAPSGAPPRTPSAVPSFHPPASSCRFLTGGLGGAVTPVPFPNTDVKGPRGDGTTPRSVGEQRAAGLLLQAPSLSTEAGGLFFALDRAGASPCDACGRSFGFFCKSIV